MKIVKTHNFLGKIFKDQYNKEHTHENFVHFDYDNCNFMRNCIVFKYIYEKQNTRI